MSRGHSNVIPFGRRPRATMPVMLQCPAAAGLAISEAIALMWELRGQLQAADGLRKIQRTRFGALGCAIEDRLESALHSMERVS